MILYGDLYILFNLAMDFVLLLATAWVRKTDVRRWRLGLGAGVGAAFALCVICFGWMGIGFVFAKAVAVIGMVASAFRWQGIKKLLGHVVTFLLINFLVAGGVQGIKQMLAVSAAATAIGVMAMVLIGVPLIFVIRQSLAALRKQTLLGRYCMPVEIQLEGEVRSMMGFMDTGNHLYEPMTGLPVVIGELSRWEGVLPEVVIDSVRCGDLTRVSLLPISRKLRIIPYRSVGTGTQWLVGIRPDWLRIDGRETNAAILALQVDAMHKGGAYEIILHPELL